MKTFKTKRAAKLFEKWKNFCPSLFERHKIFAAINSSRPYDLGYHALRDLIREFAEERGYQVVSVVVRSFRGRNGGARWTVVKKPSLSHMEVCFEYGLPAKWIVEQPEKTKGAGYRTETYFHTYDLALLAALDKALKEVK